MACAITVLRSALFSDITQCRVLSFTDVSGQPIDPIFKGQDVFFDFLTLEDGIDRLSRNVAKRLPFDTV
jgi:hypothetical protein